LGDNKSGAERLVALLGKDILSNGPGANAAKEALKQVKDEREKDKVEKAKGLYLKCITLYEKHEKQKRELEKTIKANDKELGKAVSAIENLARGGQPPEGGGEAKADDNDNADAGKGD